MSFPHYTVPLFPEVRTSQGPAHGDDDVVSSAPSPPYSPLELRRGRNSNECPFRFVKRVISEQCPTEPCVQHIQKEGPPTDRHVLLLASSSDRAINTEENKQRPSTTMNHHPSGTGGGGSGARPNWEKSLPSPPPLFRPIGGGARSIQTHCMNNTWKAAFIQRAIGRGRV